MIALLKLQSTVSISRKMNYLPKKIFTTNHFILLKSEDIQVKPDELN